MKEYKTNVECRILYQNKGSASFYLAVHFQGYLNKLWLHMKPLIPGTKIGHLQSWSILQDDSWPGTGQVFEIQLQSDIAT